MFNIMIGKKIFGIFLALISILPACCDDDCGPTEEGKNQEGILGKWVWIKSVGGIGGWTLTPESEGYTQYILLDEFYYSEFKNDTMLLKKQCDFEIRTHTFLGNNKYLVLESGFEFSFNVIQDTFVLEEI